VKERRQKKKKVFKKIFLFFFAHTPHGCLEIKKRLKFLLFIL